MFNCKCDNGENGYYKLKCISDKCSQCKNANEIDLKCKHSETELKVSQFEQTNNEYKCLNKPTGKMETKTSKRTEKVEKVMTYKDLFNKLFSLKKQYCLHKYQVYNDMFHWPKILESVSDYGPIYHMDYSENLSQLFKYEPQSSHFSKQQYSLYCTVKHCDNDTPFEYLYHLSDDMKHDHAFTNSVVNHILENNPQSEIIHFKSDNCSTQYKCKWIFKLWYNIAKRDNKIVLIYFGVSGHWQRVS